MNKYMNIKNIIFSVALLMVFGVHAEPAANPVNPSKKKTAIVSKVAVVDFTDMFNDPKESKSLEWQKLMGDAEEKIKPRLESLQKKQTEFQKKAKDAQIKGQANMDEDTMAQLTKLEHDIQVDAKAYQAYSQKLMGEMQAQFGEKVTAVVKAVAKEQGWTHVLPGPLLYVDPACDITEDVVERLNSEYRAEQRAKKFAKADKAN